MLKIRQRQCIARTPLPAFSQGQKHEKSKKRMKDLFFS